MDIHLYLQQQTEQTHPPFPPSPLPVFSIPFPPPTPPWAQGQPCPLGSLYGSGPPPRPQEGDWGGVWLRSGGVCFFSHFAVLEAWDGRQGRQAQGQ